ncbi:glycosyltransferase [Cryobacterium soli]|uniref:glycosyltransferase n=1 Tax=Cryobacterium soli TaxID=2220095 RepID=UPI001FE3096C|nr:glycosyltransferase [Cryobacterium soli]
MSVLDQLGPLDEVVVQDGGSTDGWLKQVDDLNDSRIKVVTERDAGQADALNRALGRAINPWIGWLNADDIYFEGALSRVRAAVESVPGADIVYGDFALIDAAGEVINSKKVSGISLRSLALKGCAVFSGSFFVRSDLIRNAGGFSAQFTYCMDYELYLRLWRRDGVVSVATSSRLGALRIHPGTKTSENPWSFVAEARRARKGVLAPGALLYLSSFETLKHGLTVSTTSIRASKVYGRMRGRTVAAKVG